MPRRPNQVRQLDRRSFLLQVPILLFLLVISAPVSAIGLCSGAFTGVGAWAADDPALGVTSGVVVLVGGGMFPACVLAGWLVGIGIGSLIVAVQLRWVRNTAGDDARAWSYAALRQPDGTWVHGVLWACDDALHFRTGRDHRTWAADPAMAGADEIREWLRPGFSWRGDGDTVRFTVVDRTGWVCVVQELASAA